jgi:hypothetical protein
MDNYLTNAHPIPIRVLEPNPTTNGYLWIAWRKNAKLSRHPQEKVVLMAGKRRKHKPRYQPKKERVDRVPESSEPIYSEAPLIVFISSLIDKMKEERAAVDRAISLIPIMRKWKFEDTPASSQSLEESYLSKVRTCDIFVLVLGGEYSVPVTREYETALAAGKPILVFVHNGAKDTEQHKLISSIPTRYASYDRPTDLQEVVAGSIWDELIRAHRGAIPPSAASQVISQVPLPVLPSSVSSPLKKSKRQVIPQVLLPAPKVEDFIGYVIIGLDNLVLQNFYRRLGAKSVPSNLHDLYPKLEPLPVVNIVEVNTAVTAIQNANLRSLAAPNRRKAFVRELQKEAISIASHHIKRQRTQTPAPEVQIPGIAYYLWGMEHSLARLVKLLRLEESLKEPIRIERTSDEVMFKDADHFVQLTSIIQEAAQKSRDDIYEFDRLIGVEAALLALEDHEESDSTGS